MATLETIITAAQSWTANVANAKAWRFTTKADRAKHAAAQANEKGYWLATVAEMAASFPVDFVGVPVTDTKKHVWCMTLASKSITDNTHKRIIITMMR